MDFMVCRAVPGLSLSRLGGIFLSSAVFTFPPTKAGSLVSVHLLTEPRGILHGGLHLAHRLGNSPFGLVRVGV
jgi:hypothetical protein